LDIKKGLLDTPWAHKSPPFSWIPLIRLKVSLLTGNASRMPVEVHSGARLGMRVGKSKTLLQINYIIMCSKRNADFTEHALQDDIAH
jgi:hypothetical protein